MIQCSVISSSLELICDLIDGNLNEGISNIEVGVVSDQNNHQALIGSSVWVGIAENTKRPIAKVARLI